MHRVEWLIYAYIRKVVSKLRLMNLHKLYNLENLALPGEKWKTNGDEDDRQQRADRHKHERLRKISDLKAGSPLPALSEQKSHM